MNAVLESLSWSAQDFRDIVWPVVSGFPIVGGGSLRPVEAAVLSDFADELDLLAGIDAWQIDPGTPMVRGLASRVQWGTAHNSFSIRYKLPSGQPTEFDKRVLSIQNKNLGHLFPYLTIQAYLDERGGKLLSCAAIETERLFQVAQRLVNSGALANNRNPSLYGIQTLSDGTEFIYLNWHYLTYLEVLSGANTQV